MAGKYSLGVLPLDVGALDRAGGIYQWIINWWGCQPLIKLDHVGCFTRGKGSESYIGSPLLAEMETSMHMIAESRHNRPYVLHIIVCPRFMTHFWRKVLRKYTNLMFTIPTGLSVWPNNFHETFYTSLILPIIRRRNLKGPWVVEESQLYGSCMESF